MRATIEVKSRKDAQAIRKALEDPLQYALMVVMGSLMELPTDRARKRVLSFVADQLAEEADENLV